MAKVCACVARCVPLKFPYTHDVCGFRLFVYSLISDVCVLRVFAEMNGRMQRECDDVKSVFMRKRGFVLGQC